eukprot:TRINITY_DN801_c0_g1_i1.p1 TRINITY_DN801_c0_g1~~TRINITY_DN801_c0_g1_i1.p1  ORF type:complete len:497 (-),score=128.50 TRINITY_DN801_c0_g1_i1:589-2079(-)
MHEPLVSSSSINAIDGSIRKKKILAVVATTTGAIFLFFGIFFYFFIGSELQKGLEEQMIVDGKSHPEYENWLTNTDSDDSIEYYKVSVFNLTNYDAVVAGERPIVQELGPYYYRTVTKKLTVSFRDTPYGPDKDSGDIAHYQEYEYYLFDPSKSAPGADPLTDIVYTTSFGYYLYPNQAAAYNAGQRAFIRLTVQQLLFGYGVPIGNVVLPIALITNYTTEEECLENCYFDAYRTGKDDRNTIGQQVLYAGESFCYVGTNQCWKSPERVEGTDGSIFNYNVKKSDKLVTWLSDALRTVSLKHYGDKNQKVEGIELYRFRVDKEAFLNTTYSKRNEKYFQTGPNGVVNVAIASFNLPVYLSQPHFYACDPLLVDEVKGLNPNQPDHDSFLDIEPITGYTMNAAKRLQVNFHMQKDANPPDFYKNMRDFFYPMIWIEEGGRISKESADDFKGSVYFAQDLQLALIITGCIVGSISLIVGIYMFYRLRKDVSSELGPMM